MKYFCMMMSSLVLLSGCGWFGGSESVPELVIVNVLDKDLYDDCHIKNSIQVDYMDLESYALKHWNKNTTRVVIHCSNYKCTASGEGAKLLQDLGFKYVYAYEEGSAGALKHTGIDVGGACKQKYLDDFAKPKGYDEKHAQAPYTIIDSTELQKMIHEFAQNK